MPSQNKVFVINGHGGFSAGKFNATFVDLAIKHLQAKSYEVKVKDVKHPEPSVRGALWFGLRHSIFSAVICPTNLSVLSNTFSFFVFTVAATVLRLTTHWPTGCGCSEVLYYLVIACTIFLNRLLSRAHGIKSK